MNKFLFYATGALLCTYGINQYLDIAICIFLTIFMASSIKNEKFYYFYFIFLFFDSILKLPFGQGSVFRIYQLLFIIKIIYDIKKKDFDFSINKFYLAIPFVLTITSFLYNDLSTTVSLAINLFILFYIFAKKDKSVDFYDKLFYIIGLIGAFTVIFGLFRGSIIDKWYFQRLSFTIQDPNYSSLLLNLGLFSILGNKIANKIEKTAIILLCLLGIILTVSISGILCLIICTLLYLFITNKRYFKISVVILLILGFLFFTLPFEEKTALYGIRLRLLKFDTLDFNTFTSYRAELFSNYLNYFKTSIPLINKLFGGLNTITGSFSIKMVEMFKYIPHNSFVDVLYMSGIFGFILIYGLYIYNTIINFINYKNNKNQESINIFILKMIVLFYCTNLSIFPFRYFLAIFMLTYDSKLFENRLIKYLKQDETLKPTKNSKKILWIVNTIFPYPSIAMKQKKTVFGGWLTSLHSQLVNKEDFEFAIVTTYNGEALKCFFDKKTIYYLIPCKNSQVYDPNLKIYFKEVLNDFNPDLIHIHGTEYAISLPVFECEHRAKVVTSIQGLISIYADLYKSKISNKDIFNNITFRDLIKHDNIFEQRKKFFIRGQNENKILKNTDFVIGRTTWDYSNSYAITGKDNYLKCNEILRDDFYEGTWRYEDCQKHTVFLSQANTPIKGLHILIKALTIVKRQYPDVTLYVGGENIFKTKGIKNRIKISGYAHYVNSLIQKYGLKDNVQFLGLLSEKEVKEQLLKTNVFVQASSIENSPNALGEAMLQGVPIVASNVGGTSDMLIDKEEGFLYPFAEEPLLAHYIMEVFKNGSSITKMCTKAREHALKTHNKEKITADMLAIYSKILGR